MSASADDNHSHPFPRSKTQTEIDRPPPLSHLLLTLTFLAGGCGRLSLSVAGALSALWSPLRLTGRRTSFPPPLPPALFSSPPPPPLPPEDLTAVEGLRGAADFVTFPGALLALSADTAGWPLEWYASWQPISGG